MNEEEIKRRIERHPCFNEVASHRYGRIHLPVAPKCNILCNFCNRKYNNTNEDRPGVTSAVLTPEEALERVSLYRSFMPNLAVAGIAGPGDPLANISATRKTFELIRKNFPDMDLCMSTNGVALPESVDWISDLGIGTVTVTVNAVDPNVAKNTYSFAKKNGKLLLGLDAADFILERQEEGLRELCKKDILVKVNTVVIPGVNDFHILDVAKKIKKLGVFMHNIMPLIPVKGCVFWKKGLRKGPSRELIRSLGEKVSSMGMKVMTHCRQCRADAVGRLGENISVNHVKRSNDKTIVALASSDGKVVDRHFGAADRFFIYALDSNGYSLEDVKHVKPYNYVLINDFTGRKAILGFIESCDYLVASRIGKVPSEVLRNLGVKVLTVGDGTPIEDVLSGFNAKTKV